ncbi:MAG: type II CAAX endopeptidase family protein [bacterium]
MEKILASWWKRILIYLGLVAVFYFPIDYICRIYQSYSDFFYYYYDNSVITFIALIFASVIIERLRSGKYFFTFGLQFTKETYKDIFLSFLLVFIPFIITSGLLYLFKLNIFTDFVLTEGFIYFTIIIFFFSANEELFFRGIVFQSLIDKFGITITIICTSLIFATVHIDNYSFSFMAFTNTFIAGIVLGVMYIQTKSLYLPIFYHFFWNFLQQFLLGSSISGNSFGYSIFKINSDKLPVWLFGGNYGIEGGLIGTILLLMALPLVLRYAKPSPYISSKLLKREISENIL